MVKKQNAVIWLRNKRKNVRFEELVRILRRQGWTEKNITGSHYIFSKQGCLPLLIVRPHGTKKYCHPNDVDKVIQAIETKQ